MVLTKDEATKIATRAREIEGDLRALAKLLSFAECDPDHIKGVIRAAEAAEFAQWAAFQVANCLHATFYFELPEQQRMQARAKENGQC